MEPGDQGETSFRCSSFLAQLPELEDLEFFQFVLESGKSFGSEPSMLVLSLIDLVFGAEDGGGRYSFAILVFTLYFSNTSIFFII